jgi:hypothetical protein
MGAVLTSVALAEYTASLPRTVAFTVLLLALGLPALAPFSHLLQLHPQIENGWNLLHVLRESLRVAGQGIQDRFLMHVAF